MHWNRTCLRSLMWMPKRFELFLKVVALSKSINWNEGINFTSSTFSHLMFLFDIRFSFVRYVRFRVRMDWDIIYWTQESEIRLSSHTKSAQPCMVTGAWGPRPDWHCESQECACFLLVIQEYQFVLLKKFWLWNGSKISGGNIYDIHGALR